MELIIRNIESKKDKKLFTDLASRLGLTSVVLSEDEKEDIALKHAIDEGRRSGYVDEAVVVSMLKNKLKK